MPQPARLVVEWVWLVSDRRMPFTAAVWQRTGNYAAENAHVYWLFACLFGSQVPKARWLKQMEPNVYDSARWVCEYQVHQSNAAVDLHTVGGDRHRAPTREALRMGAPTTPFILRTELGCPLNPSPRTTSTTTLRGRWYRPSTMSLCVGTALAGFRRSCSQSWTWRSWWTSGRRVQCGWASPSATA